MEYISTWYFFLILQSKRGTPTFLLFYHKCDRTDAASESSTLTCRTQISQAAYYFKTKKIQIKVWFFFFFLHMKTWKNGAQISLIIHMYVIRFFPLIALSCPYGQKLKIHIGNWSEAPSGLCGPYVFGWFLKVGVASKWVKPRLQNFLCFLSILMAKISENLVAIA